MKEKNKKMNGFQIVSGIIYLIMILVSINSIVLDETRVIGLSSIIIYTIIFYFMYSVGEIIKQLRIANEIFDNVDNQ